MKTKHLYLGICGYPECGKNTFADFFVACAEDAGVAAYLIDDGRPLRDACKTLYGVSEEDVTTHEGKRRIVKVLDGEYAVRDLLGTLGNLLEDHYGQQIVPWMAMQKAEKEYSAPSIIVCPSVRKQQPRFYRDHGMVVEIHRDGCEPRYDFDKFETHESHVKIENNQTLPHLAENAAWVFEKARHLLRVKVIDDASGY